MQLTSSEAILLDVVDLHEYDRIVSFLTPEHGLKKGVAKGARRKYSRFAGQLQPLAKVDVTWFSKERAELARISSVDLVRSAEPLYRELETLLLGGYLADHMVEFAQENEESRRLYRLLDTTIEALLEGVDAGLATRYFEVWVLRLSGIFPVPIECPQCGTSFLEASAVLPHRAEFLLCARCHPPSDDEILSDNVLEFLIRSRVESQASLAASGVDPATLAGVEEVCGRIRRAFLQHELRSYQVMQQTLGERN
jgi:DNA repair protein RecO (recombination protein O)